MSGILRGILGGNPLGSGIQSMTGAGSPSLTQIAGGILQGWQGVAAQSFATDQGTAQNAAIAKIQQDAMQKQAVISLVKDLIEGACKMIKACGEAIKGLC